MPMLVHKPITTTAKVVFILTASLLIVNLSQFRLLRVVGKGAFGKVRIVERKDSSLSFALKYIRKDEVVRSESVRNIIRERRMLEHLNHPFLCNLRYSFQDVEYLYIVVDLMNGGDLRFHISRKTFTEEAVQFWIAELACAIRYVHKQGIIHRDIKPDNVLLDSDGHVHLADFNVASDFTPGKPLHSKSGTLAYLAPEVYGGKGYSSEVDWWSLGVLFYECIYNKRPFDGNNSETLSQNIIKADPTFPVTSPPVSMPCLHAISSLLEKDKHRRIGAAGFGTFTDNPFFRPIDFEALERKELEPVFRPSSDKTNFDATYDLEELLLEEAPLEARARRQKPREQLKENATDQEIRTEELHRMIETLFEPFNYTTVSAERSVSKEHLLPDQLLRANRQAATGEEATYISTAPADEVRQAVKERKSQQSPLPVTENSENLKTGDAPSATASGRTRTSTNSPNGSPTTATTLVNDTQTVSETIGGPPYQEDADYFPGDQGGPPSQSRSSARNRPSPPPKPGQSTPTSSPPPASTSFSRSVPPNRLRGSTRSTSMGGGVSVVLDERGTGSWNEMGASVHDQHQHAHSKPSGMLGFLSRKKGRDRSPRGKERERGVLGKEGARVVISNT
ncbi:MAG: hypothetical protein M1820_001309 [Bogoriella megaspora]|nr:MAG: hypothetical protein M1820_001309 [Bogoriella megaspora]